jgi:hypothetical protein
MGDYWNICGCRPDGGHGRPDGQLCDKIFWKFRWKSFLFKNCVWTEDTVVWTMARLLQVISIQGLARPDHDRQSSGRVYLNCDSCLKETRVRTGYHIVRMVDRSSLYWNLERIWSWLSIERRPDGLLSRPDGCKLDRNFSNQWRVQTEMHVVRMDVAWSVWHLEGMALRPDEWNSWHMGVRMGWHIVRTTDRESKIFWLWSTSEW